MQYPLAGFYCVIFAAAATANPPKYSLIELCPPPGMHSPIPLGLNDDGLIVGEAKDDGQGAYMAAVAWLNNEPVRLTGIALSGAQALAANGDGTIVGTTDESFVVKAFTWNDDQIVLLEGGHGIAYAINDCGTIAGSIHDGGTRAARWLGGELEHLLPDVTSIAFDINTNGEIVGWMFSDGWRAFYWGDGQWSELPTLPGGDQASAAAINDDGVIAGWATTTSELFPKAAVLWENGAIMRLADADATSSIATDINNAGLVVGRASNPGNVRAVLWRQGQMHDLNDLANLPEGWHLTEAMAINNAGEIVGLGSQNGQSRAFLLRPVVIGDLNADGHVDVSDLLLLLAAWGPCPAVTAGPFPCPADLDGDGSVDVSDLLALLANWT